MCRESPISVEVLHKNLQNRIEEQLIGLTHCLLIYGISSPVSKI